MDRSITLLAALATTVAVGLITGVGWPGFVIGAILALSLWVMLWFGAGEVGPWTYAGASVIAVALGGMYLGITGGDNGAWWAPAFIMAGVICSTGSRLSGETAAE